MNGGGTEKARKLLGLLRHDAEDGMGVMAMLDVGQRPESIAAFEKNKGHIPILVRAALMQRLLMTITRMHDGDRDADSLPNLFKWFEDPKTVGELLPGPEFRAPFDYATKKWAEIKDQDRYTRLRHFRSRYLAHSLSAKWGFDKPTFEDITLGSKDTFSVVEALNAATGTAPTTLPPIYRIWLERAEEYWQRLHR